MEKKKPDPTESPKKFDLNSIVNTLKSLVTSEAATPQVSPDDAIGMRIKELSLMMQEMAKVHAQQAKDAAKANQLLNELFRDIEALRAMQHPTETTSTAEEERQITEKTRPKKMPPSDKDLSE